MSDETPLYPPSDHKIEQLRLRGEFPRTGALSIPALLLVVLLLGENAALSVVAVARWALAEKESSAAEILPVMMQSFGTLLTLLLWMTVAAIFATVIESRFYFRLFAHDAADVKISPRASTSFVVALVLFVGIITLFGAVLPEVAYLLERPALTPEAVFAFFELFRSALWIVFVSTLFYAVGCVIMERIRFTARHRMTRSEAEAEERETTLRADVRDAQRSQRFEGMTE